MRWRTDGACAGQGSATSIASEKEADGMHATAAPEATATSEEATAATEEATATSEEAAV